MDYSLIVLVATQTEQKGGPKNLIIQVDGFVYSICTQCFTSISQFTSKNPGKQLNVVTPSFYR